MRTISPWPWHTRAVLVEGMTEAVTINDACGNHVALFHRYSDYDCLIEKITKLENELRDAQKTLHALDEENGLLRDEKWELEEKLGKYEPHSTTNQ